MIGSSKTGVGYDIEYACQFVEPLVPVAVHLVSASSAVAELMVYDLSATLEVSA